MKLKTISALTALTVSLAAGAIALPNLSLAHNHEPLVAQNTQPMMTFKDIDKNVYKKEILQAVQLQIVQGFPDGTFRPINLSRVNRRFP
ncbi:MAG: S-layer homology domain-containing protein [Microcystaceae cyanobacterium]